MNKEQDYIDKYNTGQFTIAQLAKEAGICTGKMYYLLRDAGCTFTHKRRKPVSEEERRNRSEARKGHIMPESVKTAISRANSCGYNGLNGYGHIKRHNQGYLLAYVPKHPHAHKDGYAMLHTVIMERHIGRYLTENEVVHHKIIIKRIIELKIFIL